MDDSLLDSQSAPKTPVPFGQLLKESLADFFGNLGLYTGGMAVWAGTVIAGGLIAVFVFSPYLSIVSDPNSQIDPRDIWSIMSPTQKFASVIFFFTPFMLLYRMRAAAIHAASEHYHGRSITFWQSFRRVRGKQLRLFWLILLVSNLLNVIPMLGWFLGFAYNVRIAPGLPPAVIHNLSGKEAKVQTGRYIRGNYDRIVALFAANLALIVVITIGTFFFAVHYAVTYGGQTLFRVVAVSWLFLLGALQQPYYIALTRNYLDSTTPENEPVTPTEIPPPPITA